MSNHFNNSPAFGVTHNGTTIPGRTGLSMRDYFAAAALQGLLADDAKSAGWEEYVKLKYHIAYALVKESNIN